MAERTGFELTADLSGELPAPESGSEILLISAYRTRREQRYRVFVGTVTGRRITLISNGGPL